MSTATRSSAAERINAAATRTLAADEATRASILAHAFGAMAGLAGLIEHGTPATPAKLAELLDRAVGDVARARFGLVLTDSEIREAIKAAMNA